MLGVPGKLIETHGAVSEAVVNAMTNGALLFSQAQCAVAISGIAGPGGAVPGKPVGTVWFAWQQSGCDPCAECRLFEGDRRAVRMQAVAVALQGILRLYRK
jgi:nicotinamide-nucleotide amidase